MDKRISNKEFIVMNVIRLLLVMNVAYLVYIQDWTNVIAVTAAVVASFFPQIIKLITKVKTPTSFNMFGISFIILSQWAGTYLRAYDYIPGWDKFLHGMSAILVGLFGFILIAWIDHKAILFQNKAYGIISLIVFLTACSSAVWWEMCEYYGDKMLGTNAQLGSLVDTMGDMIICVVIAALFVPYLYYAFTKREQSYLVKEINKFIENNKKISTNKE